MQRVFFRKWRQHRGLTLERAAERIGMTHPNLSRIERGLQPYDESILDRMATAYRCEVPDLLVRDPTDDEGIWSIWDRIPPEKRHDAKAILTALARTGTEG